MFTNTQGVGTKRGQIIQSENTLQKFGISFGIWVPNLAKSTEIHILVRGSLDSYT